MIDLKLVQKQPEVLAKALADRQSPLKVDEFLELDGRRRALLAEVESLKQQTYRNLEILLVDDGSTDDTPALCDRLAETDARIRVFHKENGGPSGGRDQA